MSKERRRHERKSYTTIAQYRKGLFSGRDQTVTKDISAGGLCFFSEKAVKPGTVIKMRLFSDKKSPDRVLKGRIMWSKEYDDSVCKGYLYGLSFFRK